MGDVKPSCSSAQKLDECLQEQDTDTLLELQGTAWKQLKHAKEQQLHATSPLRPCQRQGL